MGWERERGKNRDHRDGVADVVETVEPWRPSPGKVTRSSHERGARRRRRLPLTPGGSALTVGLGRRRRGAPVFRHAGDAATPARDAADRLQAARASSGTRLPDELARRLSSALGAAVAQMRVHVGAAASAAARALRAEAFTVGRDIYFAEGAFNPSSSRGERLIAHEAAHAASQPGTVALGEEIALSEPGDAHERAADAFADDFAARAPAARGGPPVRSGGAPASSATPASCASRAPCHGGVAARGPIAPAAPIAPAPAGIYRAVAARRASDDEDRADIQDSGPGTGEGEPEGDGPDDRGPDGETDEADRERDGDASVPVNRPQRAPLADGDKRAEVQGGLPGARVSARWRTGSRPGRSATRATRTISHRCPSSTPATAAARAPSRRRTTTSLARAPGRRRRARPARSSSRRPTCRRSCRRSGPTRRSRSAAPASAPRSTRTRPPAPTRSSR